MPSRFAARTRVPRMLLALIALASVAPALRAETASPPANSQSAKTVVRVDVNVASQAELETLPRVGPALAKNILEYRKQVGTIKTVDELLNVKGIGEKMLETLRPLVTVGGQSSGSSPGKKQ